MSYRIVITTHGARGDLYPYLGIGQELQNRGHRVTLATSSNYRGEVEGAGLAFHPLRPEPPSPDDQKALMHPVTGTEWLLRRHLLPALPQTLEDLLPLAKNADVLVTHTTSLAGPVAAALASEGTLWVSAVVSPLALFSRFDPPALPVAPWAANYPALNRLVLHLLERQFGSFLKPVNRIREQNGLRPGGNVLFESCHSPQLALGLFSPLLAPPQPDWPPSLRPTGFCWPTPPAASLDPELAVFLAGGNPPLLFASASFGDGAAWNRACRDAAAALGKRALLLGGQERRMSERVVSWPLAPLSLVLPHVEVFVHQGGIGAAALGLAAGVPMVISPLSHDQPDTARMSKRAAGTIILPRKILCDSTLARAIQEALSPRAIEKRVRLAQGLAKENGCRAAADLILERCARS